MESSRQEHWSGLPFPTARFPQGIFPGPGIESALLVSPALAGRFISTVALGESCNSAERGMGPQCSEDGQIRQSNYLI